MSKCDGCDLPMPPGACHVNEAACITALKHALESATRCAECGDPVPTVVHPGCVPRLLAARGAKVGVDAAARRALDAVARALSGEPDEGEEPPGAKGGKRWGR